MRSIWISMVSTPFSAMASALARAFQKYTAVR